MRWTLQESNAMKKILCLAAAALLLLSGCTESKNVENTQASKDVFAMDTYMNLKAYGKNSETALEFAVDEILYLDDLLSVTNENSDISAINNSCGSIVSVNNETAEIIEKAIEIGDQTNGALDITVYPVLKEWGFTTDNHKILDSETLDILLKNVDYHQIKVNGNRITVPESFQLDLGALAKGYTSDKVMEILRNNGINSAVVSLGGNVQTLGRKPDGFLWKVAVIDPFSPDSTMGLLKVEDKAVITSGNYERYFIGENGKIYHHIIDPSNGYPADNGLVSVTIIGGSGIMCDALSTALFVSGYEKAVSYWRKNGDFDMILVTDHNEIFITEGIAYTFENVSEMPMEVITHEP